MKNLLEEAVNQYRIDNDLIRAHYGNAGDGTCGVFEIPSHIDKRTLCVIASCGDGWEHISVSRTNRVPNWYEMEQIKRLFFKEDETAMQLHVPSKDHISVHPHCLHLWKPIDADIPMPDPKMIA
jgi:hypothetical protein